MRTTVKSLASYKWYRKKWKLGSEPDLNEWYWVTFDLENDNADREFVFRNVGDARDYTDKLRADYPDALVAIISHTGLMIY